MAKQRVYEVAKRLDISAKDLQSELRARGQYVRSASSTLQPSTVQELLSSSPFAWRPENLPRVRALLATASVRQPWPAAFRALATAPGFWVEGELGLSAPLLLGTQAPTRDGMAALGDPTSGTYRIVSWTSSGNGYVLAGWVSLTRLSAGAQAERVAAAGLQGSGAKPVPVQDRVRSWPWLPTSLVQLPINGTLRLDDQPPERRELLAQTSGVWRLLEQARDSGVRRRRAQAGIGTPGSTAPVHLVRVQESEPSADGPESGRGREYHHRWSVRGHWRWQAYGPGRAQRRRVWIDMHTKGPDEAPLIGEQIAHVVSGKARRDPKAGE